MYDQGDSTTHTVQICPGVAEALEEHAEDRRWSVSKTVRVQVEDHLNTVREAELCELRDTPCDNPIEGVTLSFPVDSDLPSEIEEVACSFTEGGKKDVSLGKVIRAAVRRGLPDDKLESQQPAP